MNLSERKHKYSTLSVRRLGVHLPPADRLVRVRAVRATVVVVAATADVAADIAATRGDWEGRGGGNVVVFAPAASADVDDVVVQRRGMAWSLP